MPLFRSKYQLEFEHLMACLKEDTQYDTIRVTEPDMFPRRSLPLVQFTKPILGNFKVQRNKSLKPERFQDPNFTLRDFIFSDNRAYTDAALKILKARSCHINYEALMAKIAEKKKNPFINQFVFQDQYKDFLVFEPPQLEILLTVCFQVLDFNRTVNVHEDQQMILFFEKLLKKVAATALFQNMFRQVRWLKSLPQLPVYDLIKSRAAHCIQAVWSDWKITKRMIALQNIHRHVAQVNSNKLYLEQSIYTNLDDIAARLHRQYHFIEQSLLFDFNPHNYGVHMQVQEAVLASGQMLGRYQNIAVPRWFDVNLRVPDFLSTNNVNNLLALFHFNTGDCRVVPATHVIDYKQQAIDVDR